MYMLPVTRLCSHLFMRFYVLSFIVAIKLWWRRTLVHFKSWQRIIKPTVQLMKSVQVCDAT
jgi:hypothetical protein